MLVGYGTWNDVGPPGTINEVHSYICEWENTNPLIPPKVFFGVIILLMIGFFLVELNHNKFKKK